MVYKKYIKRDGKIYGPYIYHSKRIDGKVVSEYHGLKEGSKEKLNRKHVFFILAAVSLALFFILFFTLKQGTISGNIVMNLDSQYQKDVPLEGVLGIGLNAGELIPANYQIVFENAGSNYYYNLNELISSDSFNGTFYIEGKNDFGQGLGYGFVGRKVVYPDVYFQVRIVEEVQETENVEESSEEIVASEENFTLQEENFAEEQNGSLTEGTVQETTGITEEQFGGIIEENSGELSE